MKKKKKKKKKMATLDDYKSDEDTCMIEKKSTQPPDCEQDGCYCKMHWPERNGGQEYKVVDNTNAGEVTIRCWHAIDSRDDIMSCSGCDYWMFGEGVSFGTFEKYCLQCADKVDSEKLFLKVFDTECKKLTAFKKFVAGAAPGFKCSEHAECGMEHALRDDGSVPVLVGHLWLEDPCKLVAEELKDLARNGPLLQHYRTTKEGVLLCNFSQGFYGKLLKAKTKEAAAKIARAEQRQRANGPNMTTRKRLITAFIPLVASLSPEEFEEAMPAAKYARVTTESHRLQLQAIAEKPQEEISSDDVVKVVKWMVTPAAAPYKDWYITY